MFLYSAVSLVILIKNLSKFIDELWHGTKGKTLYFSLVFLSFIEILNKLFIETLKENALVVLQSLVLFARHASSSVCLVRNRLVCFRRAHVGKFIDPCTGKRGWVLMANMFFN